MISSDALKRDLAEAKKRLAKAEQLLNRYSGKVENLTWKEAPGGKKLCRHCGAEFPNHDKHCLAVNITVLKNP